MINYVMTAFMSILVTVVICAVISADNAYTKRFYFRHCMYAAGERSLESYEYCLRRFDPLLVITPEQLEQSGFKSE